MAPCKHDTDSWHSLCSNIWLTWLWWSFAVHTYLKSLLCTPQTYTMLYVNYITQSWKHKKECQRKWHNYPNEVACLKMWRGELTKGPKHSKDSMRNSTAQGSQTCNRSQMLPRREHSSQHSGRRSVWSKGWNHGTPWEVLVSMAETRVGLLWRGVCRTAQIPMKREEKQECSSVPGGNRKPILRNLPWLYHSQITEEMLLRLIYHYWNNLCLWLKI